MFLPNLTHLLRVSSQQKQNICLPTNVLFLFIQAAGLVYHRRAKRGVYHQPLWAVSHHAPACICLRLDDIPQQIADDIQDYASIYLRKCDIMKLMLLWILFFCLQEQKWRSPFVVLCFCKMRRKGAYREIRTFTKKMYERDSLFYLQIRYFMVQLLKHNLLGENIYGNLYINY